MQRFGLAVSSFKLFNYKSCKAYYLRFSFSISLPLTCYFKLWTLFKIDIPSGFITQSVVYAVCSWQQWQTYFKEVNEIE